MWTRLLIAAGGAAASLWLLWGGPRRPPTSVLAPRETATRPKPGRARAGLGDVVWGVPVALIAVAVFAREGLLLGLTAAALAWGAAGLLRCAHEVKRGAAVMDSLSMFCVLLANQARTAPSVVAGVSEAARWVRGPAAGPALAMAEGLENPGLAAAATQFADSMKVPLAREIGETLRLADGLGFGWAPPVLALAEQADAAAQSMRMMRLVVTGRFAMIVATMVLGATLLVGVAAFLPQTVAWLGSRAGLLSSAGCAGGFAILSRSLVGRVRTETGR